MGRGNREEYDWLEDPFDDAKNEQELLKAQKSKGTSCLVAALLLVLAVVGIAIASCTAMTAVGGLVP